MEDKVGKRTVSRMEEAPVYFPEETITNILLCLPTDSIHRCRTVCKAWHCITTDPGFLAAHARRRCSPEVILYTYRDVVPCTDDSTSHASTDISLDSLPISSNEVSCRRCLIRYPKTYPKTGSCLLISSCNGVLLFKRGEGFHILRNPATRQWAELPRLATSTTTGRWECHHKVAMHVPGQLINPNRSFDRYPRPWPGGVAATGDSEGNVMLGNCFCLFVYNLRTKTVRTVKAKARSNVVVSHHEFRENLMPHPHFRVSSSADLQLIHFWS
ncbi:hypothetical protein EJB05_10670, partial [Eragrostis curvula]